MTKIYRGIDRMKLTDELDLCGDGNILSNKDNFLNIFNLLGVEAKTCNQIPNKGCNVMDRKIKGKKSMRAKQIFKYFHKKILPHLSI